jgi:hypothetical protein
MDASLMLVGVGSDGNAVEQWDGHQADRGVTLRWFAPDDIGFPDYGFDVYRAFADDVYPFRFDDAAVAGLMGRTRVLVDGRIELSTADPAGLQFQPYGFSNALVLPARTMLTLAFPGRAWDLYLGTSTFGGPLTVEAYAAGLPLGIRVLLPGQQENWRTPGLDRVEVTGDGRIAMIGYRLVDATYQWSLLGHRSLPVSDVGYPDPAKPGVGGEEAEAIKRLPPNPRMDWKTTYGPNFKDLLRTLTALALHQAAPAAAAPAVPNDPRLDTDLGLLVRTALVDPHIGRIADLNWDDTTTAALNQLLAYKVVGRSRGGTFTGRPGSSSLAALDPVGWQGGAAIRAFTSDLGGGGVEIVLDARSTSSASIWSPATPSTSSRWTSPGTSWIGSLLLTGAVRDANRQRHHARRDQRLRPCLHHRVPLGEGFSLPFLCDFRERCQCRDQIEQDRRSTTPGSRHRRST